MTQWQYKCVRYRWWVPRPLGGLSPGKGHFEIVINGQVHVGFEHVEGFANWLGGQGWELVAKTNEKWGEEVNYELWFKRPVATQ